MKRLYTITASVLHINNAVSVRRIAENNSAVEFDNSGVVEFRSAVKFDSLTVVEFDSVLLNVAEFDSAFTTGNTKIKNGVPIRLKWKLFQLGNYL